MMMMMMWCDNDDDVEDAIDKRIKKRTKRNKFMLVNMGAETNVVCTLKKEAGYSEEPAEIRNSGNKVGSYLASFVSVMSSLSQDVFWFYQLTCSLVMLL